MTRRRYREAPMAARARDPTTGNATAKPSGPPGPPGSQRGGQGHGDTPCVDEARKAEAATHGPKPIRAKKEGPPEGSPSHVAGWKRRRQSAEASAAAARAASRAALKALPST